jgi:K+-transporting ATPase ATPase C chain
MLRELRPAIVMLVLITLLTGLAYPLAMTGIASVLFHDKAEGSLLTSADGKVIGSSLIGQSFTSPKYFHGRPSATTDTDPADSTKTVPSPYNAQNSGGSNYGPTSKALADRVKDDIAKLKAENPDAPAGAGVPADLVTTSGSGLDPDISPEAALYQVPRVAKARGMTVDRVTQVVSANTTSRLFGLLGEPHVNVLALNMALDAAK